MIFITMRLNHIYLLNRKLVDSLLWSKNEKEYLDKLRLDINHRSMSSKSPGERFPTPTRPTREAKMPFLLQKIFSQWLMVFLDGARWELTQEYTLASFWPTLKIWLKVSTIFTTLSILTNLLSRQFRWPRRGAPRPWPCWLYTLTQAH